MYLKLYYLYSILGDFLKVKKKKDVNLFFFLDLQKNIFFKKIY